MPNRAALFLLPLVALFAGWGSEVKIEAEDSERTLTYQCGDYESQIQSQKDFTIIMNEIRSTVGQMKEKDFIAYQNLRKALESRNIERTEKIVVQFKCEHSEPISP